MENTNQITDPLNQTSANLLGDITLTEEQQTAITKIQDWFDKPGFSEFRLGGYAGTGKTTIIKTLIDPKRNGNMKPLIGAFTGKACHVLRKKGILDAATLHSTIYDCVDNGDGTFDIELKRQLGTAWNKPNLYIVDEASMLTTDLHRDLKSFGIKLLFIGDPGQLEPVGDNPNLMKSPDYALTKIYRQAEKSPIITLASLVRNGSPVRFADTTGAVTVKPKFVGDDELAEANQVLCAKNATRGLLNRRVRNHLGKLGSEITEGEKLICLKNNRNFQMFNGLIAFVTTIRNDFHDHWVVDLKDEADKTYQQIPVWKLPFQRELEEGEYAPKHLIHMDYGYAITVHKSQGSEWEHVLVYDEVLYKTDMKRWRYTAITRASQKLTYCIN